MPTILDTPPQYVQNELDALAVALDAAIPAKQDGTNLLIATWNIRSFGSVTRKWTASSSDSPKRDLRSLRSICEIVKRFDIVALQEVTGNLRALRDMMKFLGSTWGFLMTDVTLGDAGHNERMAFVFDRARVHPSGLACELVVPPEWIDGEDMDDVTFALRRQFVRTPYAASFLAGDSTVILVSVHIDYGDDAAERIPELQGIAQWMAHWAQRTSAWHQNLLVLGDFNIDRKGDDLWKAFTSTGLTVPDDLHHVRRSIFADPSTDAMLEKFYDQVAWFTSSGVPNLTLQYAAGGGFDFIPHVFQNTQLSKTSLSYRLSDHYPLWVEFLR